jgi:hypothetical protein
MAGPPYSQTLNAQEINNNPGIANLLNYSPQSLDQFTLIGDFRTAFIYGDAGDASIVFSGYNTDRSSSSCHIDISLYWDNTGYHIQNNFTDSLGVSYDRRYTVGVDIPSKYVKVTYDGVNINIFDENGTLLDTLPFSGQTLVNFYWVFYYEFGSATVSGYCNLEVDTLPATPPLTPPYTQTIVAERLNSPIEAIIPLFTPTGEIPPLTTYDGIFDARNLVMSSAGFLSFQVHSAIEGYDCVDISIQRNGVLKITVANPDYFDDDFIVGVDIPSQYIKYGYDGNSIKIYDENNVLLATHIFSLPQAGCVLLGNGGGWTQPSNISGSVELTLDTYSPPPPPPTPSGPSLSDAVTNIITAVSTVIGEISNSIAANAETIGELMVVIPVEVALMGLGSKVFNSITGWLKPQSNS